MASKEHKTEVFQVQEDFQKSFTHTNPKPTTKPPVSDGSSASGVGGQNQSDQGNQPQKND